MNGEHCAAKPAEYQLIGSGLVKCTRSETPQIRDYSVIGAVCERCGVLDSAD